MTFEDTVRRLFLASGNQCAFPGCGVPLVDCYGRVTGNICHITACKPGWARYDPSLSDEERNGFGNIVLLCPVHHDVIDEDLESYSIERLHRLKALHEAQQSGAVLPDDSIVEQFILNMKGKTFYQGMVQLDESLTSYLANRDFPSPAPLLADAVVSTLISQLRNLPPEIAEVRADLGAGESVEVARQIMAVLLHSGWSCSGISHLKEATVGVVVTTFRQSEGAAALVSGLARWQIKAVHQFQAGRQRLEIRVGRLDGE